MPISLRQLAIIGLLGLNVLFVAAAVALLAFGFGRGFDFSDEAFYIQSAWYPREITGALSDFGHYLNFLTIAFGRDVASLRLAGLLGVLGISGLLAFHVDRYCRQIAPALPERIVLACGILLAGLAYYRFWLTTPSYNWFCLIGASLVAIGGLRAMHLRRDTEGRAPGSSGIVEAAILLASGGIFAFIGRPTASLMLGGLAGLWLILALPPRRWLAIGAMALPLCLLFFLIHVWVFHGSWAAYLGGLDVARDLGAALNAGQTIFGALDRAANEFIEIPERFLDPPLLSATVTFGVFLAVLLAFRRRPGIAWRPTTELVTSLPAVCGLAVLILVWLIFERPAEVDYITGPLGLEMCLFLTAILFVRRFLPSRTAIPIDFLLLVSLFCAAALANSFGSTSAPIAGSGTAFLLYGAAALIAILEIVPRQVPVLRLTAMTLVGVPTIATLFIAAMHPYRLPGSLFAQSEPVGIFASDTDLLLDPPTAAWAVGLQEAAVAAGWQPRTPLIDLTGGTPGAAVLLSAQTPTTPWLVGGYEGSSDYVRLALSLADADVLAGAWILTAPDGVRHVPADVLASAGLEFPGQYTLAGTVRSGYRNEEQLLWKPQ